MTFCTCIFTALIPAALLVGSGYLGCDQRIIFVVLLVIGQGVFGICYTGTFPNMVDVAPRYAGIIFGMSNTVATLTGIFSPYFVTKITTKVRSLR